MNRVEKNKLPLATVIWLIYTILFISIFFSLRAVTSISVGFLLVAGIVKQKGRVIAIIRNNASRFILAGGLVFLVMQLISLAYSDNMPGTWNDITRKIGLTVIPLAVILSGPFDSSQRKGISLSYCVCLLAASLYCLCIAFFNYAQSGDSFVLFYHNLTGAVRQHAVYFSIFVFVAQVLLLENLRKQLLVVGSIAAVLFLSAMLFLLSSKLVITFYILYLLFYMISLARAKVIAPRVVAGLVGLIVIAVAVTVLTANPVRERFRDIIISNLDLVKKEQYSPGDYFDGIQFRVIQWKFIPEILNEHRSWWKGVGPANAQPLLDQEYIAKNMYIGDPSTGDIGYRAYNSHCQPLESLLAYGIPGLLACLFILFAVAGIIFKIRDRKTTFVVLLLLVYSLVESVFETQYGIVLIAFLSCFVCLLWAERSQPMA